MILEDAIKTRRTLKLKADPHHPLPITKGAEYWEKVGELMALAGRAPFHYVSPNELREKNLNGVEPWRFHALDTQACRKVLKDLIQEKPVKSSEGIHQMLAAADALILVTWLPEHTHKKKRKFHPNVKNMEHIAATGAAIQNLLLGATAMGIPNYWSSGGNFRKKKMLEHIGIPKQEILLGAVFLFPDQYPDSVKIIKGKNAEKRGEISDYMRWAEVK